LSQTVIDTGQPIRGLDCLAGRASDGSAITAERSRGSWKKSFKKKTPEVQSSNHSQLLFEAVSFRRLIFMRSDLVFSEARVHLTFGKKKEAENLDKALCSDM
jgi:hypothetical protein